MLLWTLGSMCLFELALFCFFLAICQGLELLDRMAVQLLSRVRIFATPWIAARQASLSITISQSSLRLASIKSVMASSPITSWQIGREDAETMWDFIFFSSKITAGGDCSHEIKKCLLLGRKAMSNLDSVLKSRDITLLTKVHIVKAMVFPVIMYGYENWTMKKAECRRFDTFELWCWRRL